MEKLSSTLKQLLNEANISEAELARRTGIAQPMVNRLATGKNKNPKLETLKPIAKYFSVTFSQLLGEEDLPTNDKRADQFNSQSFQFPVVQWSQYGKSSSSTKMMATTAKLSNKAFGLLVANDEFEPRFPASTVLVVEPEVHVNLNDLVLVKKLDSQELLFTQVKDVNEAGPTKLHNLSNTSDSSTLLFDKTQHELVGVLVQTSYDFK